MPEPAVNIPDRGTLGLDLGGTSTKLVVLDANGGVLARHQSPSYARPGEDELAETLRRLIADAGLTSRPTSVGLCLPGQFEPDGVTVRYAANLPGLSGLHVPTLVGRVLGGELDRLTIVPDAQAAAMGSWQNSPHPGRLLAISLGTGVGASLLVGGCPVMLAPGTVGHLGQIDVSLSPDAPTGPDGGRGSLEAYIGLPVLRARFGESSDSVTAGIAAMPDDDPALLALARALRIAHAIYTPDSIRMLGGIGIALQPKAAAIKAMVDCDLTAVANPNWELTAENDAYLAALGAAFGAAVSASNA
ncbi:MAG: putative NBD/HSP70 family sugar kinase [Phycisphaerales bacterium]|jgi:predicted NBD/HSP70 family sugar kinase